LDRGGRGAPAKLKPRDRLVVPEKAQRVEMFHTMDYNGNGALSLAEIDKAIAECYPEYNHKQSLIRAYEAADTSDDGFIEWREFRKLLHYIVYFNNLWHQFEDIDVDGDRRLDLAEFVSGVKSVGGIEDLPDDVALAVEFQRIAEGQGHVLFGEFCTWCARRHVGHLPPDEEQRVMVSQAAI
jgi:Ca2+-binding EF-hand superfamily protein